MSSRADLESKTVPELKQICKDCDVKGYSKLAKDALISAILEKRGQAASLEQNLSRSTNKVSPDPATEQFLQRTSTKVVYSRDESEARIEKNKGLVAKRAEASGVPASRAVDSEAGAQLVRTTSGRAPPKPASASSTAAGPPTNLASSLSAARDAQATPAPAVDATTPSKKGKLVVQAGQIQKVGRPTKPPHDAGTERSAGPATAAVGIEASAASKKAAKTVQTPTMDQTPSRAAQAELKPAPAKKPGKMVVTASNIQKTTTIPTSTATAPEPRETRFQDMPSDDQQRALKNVSKSVLKLLRMGKSDLMHKKAKDLEKFLELLEVEKGRFTVYRPTDRALRGFIDESIALINAVKEEQLNQLEQQYIVQELPKVIKKNEKKIKQHVTRIDRYYTDMDAARDIVEKFIKKSPFPQSYLITVVLQKIRDKAL